MNLAELVKNAMRPHPERWNEEDDATVQYLKDKTAAAEEELARLRHIQRVPYPIAEMIRRSESRSPWPR